MTFCYRPLAAGFVTGKAVNNDRAGTRFADENPLGKLIQGLFGADDLRSAMKKFDTEVRLREMVPLEVAIRWLAHHSALDENDGIILGASKAEQVRETVEMIRKGPLPEEILTIAEDLWSAVKNSRGEII